MLVHFELELKSNWMIEELLNVSQVAKSEVMVAVKENRSMVLTSLLNAHQLINWILENTELRIVIKKATGKEALSFEQLDGFRDFIISQLEVKEGQKWVVEQMPGDIYIALRRAMAKEVHAYARGEDVLDVEPSRIVRVVSVGHDIPLEGIDFKYAIQYL